MKKSGKSYNQINHSSDNMIFDILDNSVNSIPDMETRLWNEYSTAPGVIATEADYHLLFNEYGW